MKIVFKVAAFLLVALWLPATQHCDLEAAGVRVFSAEAGHVSSCQAGSTTETCHAVEGDSYSKTSSDLRVIPPLTASTLCLLSLLVAPRLAELEPVFLAGDSPEIQALYRTWHFVRRTALPARAPDCVA